MVESEQTTTQIPNASFVAITKNRIEAPTKTYANEIDRLENALRIMAKIIAEEGEDYLPIFEKLEGELRKKHSQKNALARALLLSKEGSSFE